MYVLYADESGDLQDPNVDHMVVAGVAVHEDAIRPLAGAINSTMNRVIGQARAMQLELHGNPMRGGFDEWQGISDRDRRRLYLNLMRRIAEWQHEPSHSLVQPFVVAIDRGYSLSPTETAYGELLYLFDTFLRTGRRRGNPHNGILVADRSRYQRTLEAWVQVARARLRRPRQDPRRLHALAETPFFVDSTSTRLMQLADLLAYAAYRGYSAADWGWFAPAKEHVLTSAPSRLIHLTSDEACTCPACTSG